MRLPRDPSQRAPVPPSLGVRSMAFPFVHPSAPRPPASPSPPLRPGCSPGDAAPGRLARGALREWRPPRPDLTGRARCSHRQSRGVDAKGARCLGSRGPRSPSQAPQQTTPGPASPGSTGDSCGFPGKRRQLGNTRTAYGERIERA